MKIQFFLSAVFTAMKPMFTRIEYDPLPVQLSIKLIFSSQLTPRKISPAYRILAPPFVGYPYRFR